MTQGPPPYTVVVGVDGSDQPSSALAWAIDEARCRRGRVVAVHAWMMPEDWQLMPLVISDTDERRLEAERRLQAAVASIDAGEVPVEQLAIEGDARTVLVDAADGAQLLVVGAHGRNAIARAVLGSTSTYCIHHAPVPVTVVPAGN